MLMEAVMEARKTNKDRKNSLILLNFIDCCGIGCLFYLN